MTVESEDTWLGTEILAQIERALENRNYMTARGLVNRLAWEPTQRNFVRAGTALRRLRWTLSEDVKKRGARRQWMRRAEHE